MIHVALGGLRVQIHHGDRAVEAALAERLGPFVEQPGNETAAAPADATLESRIVGDDAFPAEATALEVARRSSLPGGGTRIVRADFALDLVRGPRGWEGAARERASPGRPTESCLRLLLAAALLDRGRLLLHAAATAFGPGDGAPAAVLFGPSGAGKTTFAYLAGACGADVLGDDLIVVGGGDGGSGGAAPSVWGTPFSGDRYPPGRPLCRPLRGLFALEHAAAGDDDALREIDPAEAAQRLLRCVVSYRTDADAAGLVLRHAACLIAATPPAQLAFRPTAAAVWLVRTRVGTPAP
ncbi:MAG TPA: hypothetical protein VG389_02535 [Myxococcota bacterium]|jgi:hypothetical protein|nr:hypothetical protein [Myxococcota bacterium]